MSHPSRYIHALALLVAVMGVVDGFIARDGNQSPLALVYAFAIAALLYHWCHAHAALRGMKPPHGFALLVAFVWPVGVPLYFLRTMPFVAASWATAKAIALFAALSVVYEVIWAVCARL